jgi:hypothetical protein
MLGTVGQSLSCATIISIALIHITVSINLSVGRFTPQTAQERIQWEGHYSLYNTNNIFIQKLFSFQSRKGIGYLV